MMREKTTVAYWALVESEMVRSGLSQIAAERTLFVRTVRKARLAGHYHSTIAARLHVVWGFSLATYYRRLSYARRTICIP